ncbi:hypothetical protein C8J57DRAFT_1723826 [Mycena rebaudengoi]|nr:hypothetical protein C8J57DRAFT_1723826 [Mycena rebaudengoi]
MSLPALDTITGALLIGTWANSLLYTAELVQAIYYFRHFKHDDWKLKTLVAVTFLIDTVSTVVDYVCVYLYVITHAGDPLYLVNTHWPLPFYVIATAVVAIVVQTFLVVRYWRITQKTIVALFLALLIASAFGGSFACGLMIALYPTFEDRRKIKIPATIWLVTEVIADLGIAAALLWELRKVRDIMGDKRSVLDRLVAVTLQTGTAAATLAVAALIAYLLKPESNLPGGITYTLGRVYVLTLVRLFPNPDQEIVHQYECAVESWNARQRLGEPGSLTFGVGGTDDPSGIHVHRTVRTSIISIDPKQAFLSVVTSSVRSIIWDLIYCVISFISPIMPARAAKSAAPAACKSTWKLARAQHSTPATSTTLNTATTADVHSRPVSTDAALSASPRTTSTGLSSTKSAGPSSSTSTAPRRRPRRTARPSSRASCSSHSNATDRSKSLSVDRPSSALSNTTSLSNSTSTSAASNGSSTEGARRLFRIGGSTKEKERARIRAEEQRGLSAGDSADDDDGAEYATTPPSAYGTARAMVGYSGSSAPDMPALARTPSRLQEGVASRLSGRFAHLSGSTADLSSNATHAHFYALEWCMNRANVLPLPVAFPSIAALPNNNAMAMGGHSPTQSDSGCSELCHDPIHGGRAHGEKRSLFNRARADENLLVIFQAFESSTWWAGRKEWS